ncbi:DUF2442 domain-containing protein [Methylobacterium sp. J-068]|uniref:DUF2442 domain-containing protein n=1 Tax=Methylobacterium sp. J-068 TaxID=2836649 RepID=UPI001FBB364F|nr:DUF2442 domain-containing protein [Methylobacterium sp. J-068]MCJ2036409.1 DUF2442 domain-containing protein [Methylobacterium sp. J-068]
MSATDTITVGRALPKLASVEPANGPFSVSVTWAAGSRVGRTDIVDLAPMIFTFKVFKPLRDDPELFRSVQVGDWGVSLVWPGNDDLDVGAESVEEMAEEAMTNSDFAEFLKRTGFTLDAAAAQLGIARRLVAYYAKDRQIPRYIALACRQLEAEHGVSEPRRERAVAQGHKDYTEGASLYGAPLYATTGLSADDIFSPVSLVPHVLCNGIGRAAHVSPTSDLLAGVKVFVDRSMGARKVDPATGVVFPLVPIAHGRREDF